MRHDWKDVELAVAVDFDGSFQFSGAVDTFLVENVDETVEDLEMEGGSEQAATILPAGTGREEHAIAQPRTQVTVLGRFGDEFLADQYGLPGGKVNNVHSNDERVIGLLFYVPP